MISASLLVLRFSGPVAHFNSRTRNESVQIPTNPEQRATLSVAPSVLGSLNWLLRFLDVATQ